MRKLYLLLDEWNSDKNFVFSELELIKQRLDVTVICDEVEDKKATIFPEGVKFLFYSKRMSFSVVISLIKAFLDIETWKELSRLRVERGKISKASEIVRFYINAELFYGFMKKNGLVEHDSDAIYYSYWYFWKCFAITKHRDDMPGIRAITRTHEYELFTVSIPSRYQPFKYAMDRNLDRIVFISKHGRDYYLDKYVRQAGGLEIPDDDIDKKYLLYHLGTKDYGKLNPYKRGNVFNLVSCSSVIPRKRVGLILEALSHINKARIHWTHFGDGELMDELKDNARRLLGCKDNISYELMGHTNHEDIMNYYMENSVDAFAMVAVSEGNPVSVMEAMSFGIPIVSYDICNMRNVVMGNGILVPEECSAEQFANEIEQFAELSDSAVSSYRVKSREIWEEDYRESKNNQKFLSEVLLNL